MIMAWSSASFDTTWSLEVIRSKTNLAGMLLLKIALSLIVFATNAPIAMGGVPFVYGSHDSGRTALGLTFGSTPTPTRIDLTNLAGERIVQAATGDATVRGHSLLLTADGEVYSFGSNYGGATGLGTGIGDTLVPTQIDTTNLADRSVIQVAAGGSATSAYSLLLTDDGKVYSFGSNNSGRTGQGLGVSQTFTAKAIDTTNLEGKSFTQISAGDRHSLILAEDGSVYSFGRSVNGQTGLNVGFGNTHVATPIDIRNLGTRKIVDISAGLGGNSLILADDGTVFSFGFNGNGRTGLGIDIGNTLIATPIDSTNIGSTKITQVSAGVEHGLLLGVNGTVFSFGWNGRGQTGLGTTVGDTLIPTPIDATNYAGKNVTKIAAGGYHSLLLTDDGTMFSFGADSSEFTLIATEIDHTNLAGRVVDIYPGHYHSFLIVVPEPASLVLSMLAFGFFCRRIR